MSNTLAVSAPHIRWLIRRDMGQVLAIEGEEDEAQRLSEDEILNHLRQKNTIGMVAEQGEDILGYMFYTLHKTRIEIIRFVVCPHQRRNKVGTAMISKLIGKMINQRTYLKMVLPDHNLAGQLFLRSCGFRAVKVLKKEFDNEDGYVMTRQRNII